MKNLTSIINNLDLTKGNSSHELQNQVPDIVKTIVDRLFDQLAFVYPAWKYTWDTKEKIKGAKKEWVKSFFENDIITQQQIAIGLKKARSTDTDFIPSCGKFVSWCKSSPENMGWPSVHDALKQCIRHRNNQKFVVPQNIYIRPMIIELCKRVDWWLMNIAKKPHELKNAEKHFLEKYMELLNSGYVEPQQTEHDRLPTQEVVKAGMSEQQKADKQKRDLEHIKNMKKKLKQSRYK